MEKLLEKAVNEQITAIKQCLDEAEQMRSFTNRETIAQRSYLEDTLYERLEKLRDFAYQQDFYAEIAQQLAEFQVRLDFLPPAPRIEVVTRARNLILLNPRILVVDDTTVDGEPRIARVAVIDCKSKAVLFDQPFASQSSSETSPSSPDELLSQEHDAINAVPIERVWLDLLDVLSGHYVLALNLELAQIQLAVTAGRFRQQAPILIGESLLDLCLKYLRFNPKDSAEASGYVTRLVETLHRRLQVSSSMQTPCTALEHATNIMRILHEIAQGTFSFVEDEHFPTLL